MFYFISQFLGLRKSGVTVEVSVGRQLRRTAAILAVLLALHVAAMMAFEREQFTYGVFDAVWLTVTSVLTVGYGDMAAATVPGKTATMLLLYTAAIFIAARVASLAVEARMDRRVRMREGTWRWNMRDHILILNAPSAGAEQYFVRLLTQLRADPEYRDAPVLILSDTFPDGLPEAVRDLGAAYRRGSAHDAGALTAADVDHARHIVVLAADEYHPKSDSLSFDILLELHELYTPAKIIVEVVDDQGRERFRRFGAHVLLRSARAYPEMIVRAIACPGSESIVEDLLDGAGGTVARRYNVRLDSTAWSEVVYALMSAGIGTALAYVGEDRRVVANPDPNGPVRGRGVIVLTRPPKVPSRAEVQAAIAAGAPVG